MKFFLILLLLSLISLSYGADGNSPSSSEISEKFPKIDESDCSCSLGTSKRIVNGEEAERNLVPWQVSLAWSDKNEHFCGGIIINPDYILTTVHCLKRKNKNLIKVIVGLHSYDDTDLDTNTYYVEKTILNTCLSIEQPGDIALIKLKKKIKFIKGKIEPACLNFIKREYASELMASGWGETMTIREDFVTGERITEINLSKKLKKAYFYSVNDCKEHNICVSSKDASLCIADSGGPLHYTVNGRTTVEGLASKIDGKLINNRKKDVLICLPGSKSYFSRLSFYKNWFEDIVSDNYCTLEKN